MIEWVAVAVAALAVALLIKAFLLQAFYIPSESMTETLHINDRVLVNKLSYRIGDIDRGDIIVFDYRVVHRGMANAASAARPVLYSTFSRPWFRDALNFPDDALFGAKGGGGSGGFGGGGGKAKKGKAGKKKR